MTITASTYRNEHDAFVFRSYCLEESDIELDLMILENQMNQNTKDVIVNFNEPEFITDFTDNELTSLSAEMAESTFNELWKDEDDSYWESYL